MRNQNSFAYPCFSGECGLCSHCCGFPYEYHDSEEMHRADTNCQFYESQLPELTKSYYSKMNKLQRKRKTYVQDIIPKKKIISEALQEESVYKLIEGFNGCHGNVCDDIVCKMIFHKASDGIKAMVYTGLPVYTRMERKEKYKQDAECHDLCALCIEKF